MNGVQIIVFSGLPGSGKSTLAEAIATERRYPLFSVDPIESALVTSGIQRSFVTGLAAYLVVETLAADHLHRGMSVIIDAVNSVQEAREMWYRLSTQYTAPLLLIECQLDPHVHRQRIEARVRHFPGLPEVTWEDVEQQRAIALPWTEDRLIVDTAQTREENREHILQYIAAHEPPVSP